jgi:hypothetical protein
MEPHFCLLGQLLLYTCQVVNISNYVLLYPTTLITGGHKLYLAEVKLHLLHHTFKPVLLEFALGA